jgi:hypothetical protein
MDTVELKVAPDEEPGLRPAAQRRHRYHEQVPRGVHRWSRRPSRRELGLWVALPQPWGEHRNDGEADDEEADANEDLDAAFLGLVANVPGGGENQHQGERVQAVHEPVALRTMPYPVAIATIAP